MFVSHVLTVGSVGLYLIYYTERTVLETGACDAEEAYLTGLAHVLADAWTDVEIAYAHDAKRLAGILGQFVQLHPSRDVVSGNELVGYGQVQCDEPVHLLLHLSHLFLCGLRAECVVDFGLLALDVHVP